MENKKKETNLLRTVGVTTCLLLAVAITGCATTLRGQVLDAQTGQPIPGAVVLGVWTKAGGMPGLVHTDLVGVREAETDGEGRFELEGVSGWLLDEKSITVYKFGYVAWSNQFIFPTFARREETGVPPQVRLDPFPPDGNHRKHLDFIDQTGSIFMYGWQAIPKLQRATERERALR
jgi:hypothetical protein